MGDSFLGQRPNPKFANFNLKIGTFNIQGQNKKNSVKLRKINKIMNRGNFDILLLQETRSDGTATELKRWKKASTQSKYSYQTLARLQ